MRVNGEMLALEDVPRLDKNKSTPSRPVVDRLVAGEDVRRRLTDSVELALKQSEGLILVQACPRRRRAKNSFEKNACPDCAISFEEMKPRSFSFNNPFGACPTCAGLGAQLIFDEDLVVPDKTLSLADGAIHAWRHGGFRMVVYYKHLLKAVAAAYEIDMDTPYNELPESFRQVLLHGSGDEPVTLRFGCAARGVKPRSPLKACCRVWRGATASRNSTRCARSCGAT